VAALSIVRSEEVRAFLKCS